jgi:hypothetical protein
VSDKLIEVVLEFIKEFTGDDDDESFESYSDSRSKHNESDIMKKKNYRNGKKKANPCILIFD